MTFDKSALCSSRKTPRRQGIVYFIFVYGIAVKDASVHQWILAPIIAFYCISRRPTTAAHVYQLVRTLYCEVFFFCDEVLGLRL
jgi:hypothetical protein